MAITTSSSIKVNAWNRNDLPPQSSPLLRSGTPGLVFSSWNICGVKRFIKTEAPRQPNETAFSLGLTRYGGSLELPRH
jgi:hypothetical protein